ncbi:murein transglycosylase domain-containing protein [Calditerrivibrio nitroreducens]|uniref:Lytic transglycosylase catalytic n=1 Tax=Calditerrivibrio nitroreducens TaxID=477976 RepID=A0A2J6WJM0_9BACT|nr:MAG: hypothetical protein C0187_05395 [Calditerrivibrio nitroreducens]
MKKLAWLFIISILLFLNSIVFADDYLKEIDDFEKYKKQVNDDFAKYLEIVNREFDNFKKEVYKEWGDYLIPSKTKWVEYSSDFKVRSIVDFEKNRLTIQVKTDTKSDGKDLIKKQVEKVANETIKDAFYGSKPLVNIEKKSKEQFKGSSSSTLPDNKIVGDFIKESDGNKSVDNILQNGSFSYSYDKKGNKIATFSVQIKASDREKALKFKAFVDEYARRYNLEPSLIYAVIHTESYFNPMATSPAPAYGLMQIIPTQAGKDAARILFGSPLILLPSFLYNPENNINVGATYINLIKENYIKEIKDDKSRLYVAIVGYNVGLRNVYRVFSPDGDPKKAFYEINRLSSEEVYAKISKNLPQRGGVDYLIKILSRMDYYKDL